MTKPKPARNQGLQVLPDGRASAKNQHQVDPRIEMNLTKAAQRYGGIIELTRKRLSTLFGDAFPTPMSNRSSPGTLRSYFRKISQRQWWISEPETVCAGQTVMPCCWRAGRHWALKPIRRNTLCYQGPTASFRWPVPLIHVQNPTILHRC